MSTGTFTNVSRTIYLPWDVKPWKATDPIRPVIGHGWLHRRDDGLWLLTTDSFSACAIRVDGDAVEGWVPVGAMRWLAKGREGIQESRTAWRFHRDGYHVFDVAGSLDEKAAFPLKHLSALWDEPADECGLFGLDPWRLKRLAEALGAHHGRGLRLRVTGAGNAIHVTPRGVDDRRGVLMPIRLDDGTSEESS